MIPLRDSLPSKRLPAVTVALIVVNLLVFVYQGYLSTQTESFADVNEAREIWYDEGLAPPPLLWQTTTSYGTYPLLGSSERSRSLSVVPADQLFVTQYALIAGELLSGRDLPPAIPVPIWATIFTSMFLHGGIMHLVGNMLYLWIFGDNVEDSMGPIRYLIFYLLCGAAAAASQIVINPGTSIPMLGASGAIAGVLAAYFVLFPRAKVLTLIPIFFFLRLVSIPALFLLGFWFILQVVNGVGSLGAGGGTAWFAHIGGFVAGALLVAVFRRPGTPLRLLDMIRSRR